MGTNSQSSLNSQKGSAMNIVQIPVKDLTIDLPVSDANVAQKKASLAQNGMVQPVTVWANGQRIIDGFHRVVAAGLLGWETVPCVVRDCDEEAFWDARIQSARQHADITEERLQEWIVECWKSSKWGQSGPYSYKGKWKDELAPVFMAAFDSLGESVDGGAHPSLMQTPKQKEIHQWLSEKAKQWNLSFAELLNAIASKWVDSRNTATASMGEALKTVRRAGVKDYTAALQAADVIDKARPGQIGLHAVSAWAKHGDKKADTLIEEARRLRERRREVKQILEPGAIADKVRRGLMRHYDELSDFVTTNAKWLKQMPDGPELLIGQAEWAIQTLTELWPGAEKKAPQVPEIIAENKRLRQELAQAREALAIAERRLAEQLSRRIPSVSAVSSAEYESRRE
jgi:hypothetical protein